MSRIDVQTLVLAFEKRIEALERNPPEMVKTSVIVNLLEKSIDEIIKDHFLHLIRKDLEVLIRKELKNNYSEFITKTVTNILGNQFYRDEIENKLKNVLLKSVSQLHGFRDD